MSWDWKKMLRRPSQKRVERPLIRVPPRNRYWPSGAKRAAPENPAKIMADIMKALGMMAGLTLMAKSRRGPEM